MSFRSAISSLVTRHLSMEGRYSLWDPAQLYIRQERERAILKMLNRHGFRRLGTATVLEIGCGTGSILREFIRFGVNPSNATGIDIDEDRLEVARRAVEGVTFRSADAAQLPFDDASFDLVLAFTVFTSISDAAKRAAAASEILRVLRPGGALLWYDFRFNPINRETQALRLGDVRRLFGRKPIETRPITLAPPIVRIVAPRSWLACNLLETVPLLRTHLLALVRR
jgi:ubiquinone/menaquinone biosynthesis C-methylase UbiE